MVKNPPTNAGDTEFDPWLKKIPWKREWQRTPVLSPGKSHGQRSPSSYSPWGHKDLDTTEQLGTDVIAISIIQNNTSIVP